MSIRHLAIAGLLIGVSAAQSQVIFSDNFNADLRGLNKTTFVGGWTVTNGTVDVIGAGPGNEPGAGPGAQYDATIYNFGFSQGNFIDLDGSVNDAGVFAKAVTLTAGQTYSASFQLAGSQRGTMESVNVSFGTASASFTYGSGMTFTTSTLLFTPTTTGSYSLSFAEPGTGTSNSIGLLLDNVTISAVPEPSIYLLLLCGLIGVHLAARRRFQ